MLERRKLKMFVVCIADVQLVIADVYPGHIAVRLRLRNGAEMEAVAEGNKGSFPEEEQRILQLWSEIDAFGEQQRRTQGNTEFVFFDGPPFATGLPHYGHILAGTIKDVVTRCDRQIAPLQSL